MLIGLINILIVFANMCSIGAWTSKSPLASILKYVNYSHGAHNLHCYNNTPLPDCGWWRGSKESAVNISSYR